MSGEELLDMIQSAIDDPNATNGATSVLGAIRAHGLVIGENVAITTDVDRGIIDNCFGFGLALVRVVPHE